MKAAAESWMGCLPRSADAQRNTDLLREPDKVDAIGLLFLLGSLS